MTTALWPLNTKGWIYWGVCTPHLALARGYPGGGGGYFHDKAKNIRDKMSNLSKLLTTITIEIQ